MNEWQKARDQTIARIYRELIRCKNFFDWDLCNDGCDVYRLCSALNEVHNINQLGKKRKFLFQVKEEIP